MDTASSTTHERRPQNHRFDDVNDEPDKILPPLPPIAPVPSDLSLRRAVGPIHHLVTDLPNHVSYALDKCQNPKDGLTQEQSATIFLYTLEWPENRTSFYDVFNRALRAENRIEMIPFLSYYQLFMSAFSKLPPGNGQVWRGEAGNGGANYAQGM